MIYCVKVNNDIICFKDGYLARCFAQQSGGEMFTV